MRQDTRGEEGNRENMKNGRKHEKWQRRERNENIKVWRKERHIKRGAEEEKREEGRERAEEEEVQSVCSAYTPWHPTVVVMKLLRGGGGPLV